MQIEVQAVAPEEVSADVLAVPVAGEDGLDGAAARLDGVLDGLLSSLAGEGELRDELGTAPVVHLNGQLRSRRVAAAGLGARAQVDSDALRTAAAAVARETAAFAETLAWVLDDSLPLPLPEQARAVIEGTVLGAYEPGRWKHDAAPQKLATLVLCGADAGLADAAALAARVAEWTNRARHLVNSPPNEATPERLAERAAEIASSLDHLETEAHGWDEIRERGMGAF